MPQTTVSHDYRIEVPEEVRREVSLVAGQRVEIFVKSGVIMLVPDQPLSVLRGFLRGMDIAGIREEEDPF